ncbi:hypothetical protein Hypma_008054 [Hypsizygus marmoreus]|uniref:Uncharacterized protein n=1 Tax=Hypsizygus marmoreus TaxID=39966 RepID=A0A369JY63_HYPMA|nr:hypothetical protein Hypma_008054 [Hypsizygus marmoreus]
MAENGVLPDLLGPVVSYLADTLPPPLYTFLINFLSHCLALLAALYSLVISLASTHPLEWDAQSILPPIITVLAAYLALSSFYRTTSWMLRTTLWFVKWGTILGALTAGAGWYMGSANENGVGGYGVIPTLGNFVLDMINGQGQNAAGGSRSRSQKQRYRASPERKKPKPWDSFERHREWQYQETEGRVGNADAQTIINDIMGAASSAVKDSWWWSMTKSIVEGGLGEQTDGEGVNGNDRRKRSRKAQGKTKAGSSRSR